MQKELLLSSVLFYIQICIYIYVFFGNVCYKSPTEVSVYSLYNGCKSCNVKSKVFVCLYFICVYSLKQENILMNPKHKQNPKYIEFFFLTLFGF